MGTQAASHRPKIIQVLAILQNNLGKLASADQMSIFLAPSLVVSRSSSDEPSSAIQTMCCYISCCDVSFQASPIVEAQTQLAPVAHQAAKSGSAKMILKGMILQF